uniref:Uncharacterized protein n=1 Tax=Anguilla anguilla TaxID=7936 RepID=A0A0E9SSW8_ANGAN
MRITEYGYTNIKSYLGLIYVSVTQYHRAYFGETMEHMFVNGTPYCKASGRHLHTVVFCIVNV